MGDNNFSWTEIISLFFTHPEKMALFLVLIAGAWRWIRELWRESKEDKHHESLVETLIKENRQLREEQRQDRHLTELLIKENHRLQEQSHSEEGHKSND